MGRFSLNPVHHQGGAGALIMDGFGLVRRVIPGDFQPGFSSTEWRGGLML